MQNASKFCIPAVGLSSAELDYVKNLLTASTTQREGV